MIRSAALGLIAIGLAACSSGSDSEPPLNTDYSALRLVESRDTELTYASSDEQFLLPLRNGLRLSTLGSDVIIGFPTVTTPVAGGQGSYSDTTVQVEGVDEADPVKYDGRHIYTVRTEPVVPVVPGPTYFRNVLKIVRTDPATAATTSISEFATEGHYNSQPLLYQLQDEDGQAQYLALISQDYQAWLQPQPVLTSLIALPDHTTLQLLDARDPYNVSQAWKVQLNGWFRASRKIGDHLYLVTSYRPRLPTLVLPADTEAKRQANERRILLATAQDLLPQYRENDGAFRPLARPHDCLLAAGMDSNEGFRDLIVVTAISLSQRRITDVNCVSTNINAVYMSRHSLYVAGRSDQPTIGGTPFTRLHKFALHEGDVSYRATGSVIGELGWRKPSYFMDEHQNDLRILTTEFVSGNPAHHLSVLRETAGRRLTLLSTIPNAERPEPIGKPREQVHAVRFFGDRAYVVTARLIDPLYGIDLSNPADPVVAGQLELPGISTYLHPFGPAESPLLLSLGVLVDDAGFGQGIKVELFDVSDISQPRSLDQEIFGQRSSHSDAIGDPHALTFMTLPGTPARYRVGLPIEIYNASGWNYSGLHLLEISGIESGSPQLQFHGAIKTAEPSPDKPHAPYGLLKRGVLHDDSVFVVHGNEIISSLWDDIHPVE